MQCKYIFRSALKLLGEIGNETDNPDYTDRAPYIIAAFISEAFDADKKYRIAHGLDEADEPDQVYIDLDDEFPLCDKLAPMCAFYLASLLIADENPEISESYYDRYCDSISSFIASLPTRAESIKNIY